MMTLSEFIHDLRELAKEHGGDILVVDGNDKAPTLEYNTEPGMPAAIVIEFP
jgi:uncharacterized protein (DUF1330 family)